jgi:ribosomal protein S18 acetylase RimI-like enzyme
MREQNQQSVTVRDARRDDVPRIVELLADDQLGAGREELTDPLPSAYWQAFEAIDADPRNRLLVAETAGRVVGTLQLTFVPGLSRCGSERAQIEAVRVAREARGAGLGQRLMREAIDRARARGCRLVQLTTDASRGDAHRFYEALGFAPTHVGMKLPLDDQ